MFVKSVTFKKCFYLKALFENIYATAKKHHTILLQITKHLIDLLGCYQGRFLSNADIVYTFEIRA